MHCLIRPLFPLFCQRLQALLAQMLAEGYGCKQDLEESRRWAERARCRGYQMSGVYCEL